MENKLMPCACGSGAHRVTESTRYDDTTEFIGVCCDDHPMTTRALLQVKIDQTKEEREASWDHVIQTWNKMQEERQ